MSLYTPEELRGSDSARGELRGAEHYAGPGRRPQLVVRDFSAAVPDRRGGFLPQDRSQVQDQGNDEKTAEERALIPGKGPAELQI